MEIICIFANNCIWDEDSPANMPDIMPFLLTIEKDRKDFYPKGADSKTADNQKTARRGNTFCDFDNGNRLTFWNRLLNL